MTIPEPLTFNGDEHETVLRPTGPRRTRPAVCPVCGADVPEGPKFGDVTCGRIECRDAAVRR